MPARYPVKWFGSTFRGAPVLSGTAGAFIAVLDACLINGFGAITPTKIEVAGNIATATVSAGDTFAQHAVIQVSGASDAALNGEARVLTSTPTSFTFATDAADTAGAAGTISVRYAPAGGWEKKFNATNKAVYRSTDAAAYGGGMCLQVDDTAATSAALRAYQTMTDVDTGAAVFPTAAQASGSSAPATKKSNLASAAARPWRVFADSRLMMWHIASENLAFEALRGFGDMIPLNAADEYSVALSAGVISNGGYSHGALCGGLAQNTSIGQTHLASNIIGTADPSAVGRIPLVGAASGFSMGDDTLGGLPTPTADVFLSRYALIDAGVLRACVPGSLHLPHNTAGFFKSGALIAGGDDLAGRLLMAFNYREAPNQSVLDTYAFVVDLTGPWRPA